MANSAMTSVASRMVNACMYIQLVPTHKKQNSRHRLANVPVVKESSLRISSVARVTSSSGSLINYDDALVTPSSDTFINYVSNVSQPPPEEERKWAHWFWQPLAPPPPTSFRPIDRRKER